MSLLAVCSNPTCLKDAHQPASRTIRDIMGGEHPAHGYPNGWVCLTVIGKRCQIYMCSPACAMAVLRELFFERLGGDGALR